MTEPKNPGQKNARIESNNEELRIFIIRLNKLLNQGKSKAFFDRISREAKRLLDSKKIQGQYESMGDKILNDYVDRKYPYKGDGSRNDKLNTLLKSNWYLNIIYKRMQFPIPPEKFINEKVYRYHKRGASLFEWYMGLYFFGTGGNLPGRSKQIKKNLHNYWDGIFAEITTKLGNEKELELTWYEFKKHQNEVRDLN